MARLLLPLLLIVVPIASYMLWLRLSEQSKRLREEGKLPHWRDAPWTLIVLATLGSMAAMLAILAIVDGAEPRGTYTPPAYVDGEIVPSEVKEP